MLLLSSSQARIMKVHLLPSIPVILYSVRSCLMGKKISYDRVARGQNGRPPRAHDIWRTNLNAALAWLPAQPTPHPFPTPHAPSFQLLFCFIFPNEKTHLHLFHLAGDGVPRWRNPTRATRHWIGRPPLCPRLLQSGNFRRLRLMASPR